ncbi:hypothetical protein [Nocardia carnea]|uniref:hypothetical protein n=1 Tax=Nocardia carnea TaxID=37328 RepID=UPI0024564307|nr:hypothetical protein [Nocardia carnea]
MREPTRQELDWHDRYCRHGWLVPPDQRLADTLDEPLPCLVCRKHLRGPSSGKPRTLVTNDSDPDAGTRQLAFPELGSKFEPKRRKRRTFTRPSRQNA